MTTHSDPEGAERLVGYVDVRDFALRFPEAIEEFPWGHSAIKVRNKIFVTLGSYGGELTLSFKLPDSSFEALLLPFTSPTGYGMGKHGWVTAKFDGKRKPPMPLLRGWIEESYRAIAPKRLVKRLDEEGLAPVAKKAAIAKRVTKKKASPRRKRG